MADSEKTKTMCLLKANSRVILCAIQTRVCRPTARACKKATPHYARAAYMRAVTKHDTLGLSEGEIESFFSQPYRQVPCELIV